MPVAAFDKASKAALLHRSRSRRERFAAKEDFFADPDDDERTGR